jgi:hypothetical protein
MDATNLTKNIVAFLVPFLPYLIKSGEESAKEIGKKFGNEAWEQAKSLWNKLRPRVEAKTTMSEAIQDAAQSPDDEDSITVLQAQLKKLLIEDHQLAREISELMQGQVVQRVLAERSSNVRNVKQAATGEGEIRQDVIARDKSTIEGVRQKKQ